MLQWNSIPVLVAFRPAGQGGRHSPLLLLGRPCSISAHNYPDLWTKRLQDRGASIAFQCPDPKSTLASCWQVSVEAYVGATTTRLHESKYTLACTGGSPLCRRWFYLLKYADPYFCIVPRLSSVYLFVLRHKFFQQFYLCLFHRIKTRDVFQFNSDLIGKMFVFILWNESCLRCEHFSKFEAFAFFQTINKGEPCLGVRGNDI